MSELLAAVDDERVTARFVRFLIAEGVAPAPRAGRSNADYGEDHVGCIRRYLSLRDLGLSASRTKEVVAGSAGGGIPVPIGPGLTLIVDQHQITAPVRADDIAAKIAAAIQLIQQEDHEHGE